MLVQKSVQNLDETFESKDKRVVYFQEDYDTRENVIFNHLEVEGLPYVYEDTLIKDFLATTIIDIKKSLCHQVVAVNGDFSECVPFVVKECVLFSIFLYYNNGELDDCIPSEKAGKWLTKNKGKYHPPPNEFNKFENLRIVSIPYISYL